MLTLGHPHCKALLRSKSNALNALVIGGQGRASKDRGGYPRFSELFLAPKGVNFEVFGVIFPLTDNRFCEFGKPGVR